MIFAVPARRFAALKAIPKGWLYFLLIVPILGALNFVFPPFHAPDDYDHVKRAYGVSRGAFWPETAPGRASGGAIDAHLADFIEASKPVVLWRIPHDGSSTYRPVKTARPWSDIEVHGEFPGAASYFPLIYAPQAAAIWFGRTLALSVETTIQVGRFVNGVLAAALIAGCAARFSPVLGTALLVLVLPKSLLHFAANSLDPILHALTLCIVCWFLGARTARAQPRFGAFAAIALCLLAVAGARPPLLALAALPLWVSWQQRNLAGAAVIVAAALVVCAWFAAVMPLIVDPRCGATGTLAEKATSFVVNAPGLIGHTVALKWRYYFGSFVGELGWGNGPLGMIERLPAWIYIAAAAMLLFGLAHDATAEFHLAAIDRLLLLAVGVAIVVGVFFSMYAVCTAAASSWIGGVQGRYFVTSCILGAIALAGASPWRPPARDLYFILLYCFLSAGFVTLVYSGVQLY